MLMPDRRQYRNLDKQIYTELLTNKVINLLELEPDLYTNGELLVFAMYHKIDVTDDEFPCDEKDKIRSVLEDDWVYSHPRLCDMLISLRNGRL